MTGTSGTTLSRFRRVFHQPRDSPDVDREYSDEARFPGTRRGELWYDGRIELRALRKALAGLKLNAKWDSFCGDASLGEPMSMGGVPTRRGGVPLRMGGVPMRVEVEPVWWDLMLLML